jgi:hypothetical protein
MHLNATGSVLLDCVLYNYNKLQVRHNSQATVSFVEVFIFTSDHWSMGDGHLLFLTCRVAKTE